MAGQETVSLDKSLPDRIWYEDVNGKTQRLIMAPNKMLIRKCVYDESKYLIGEAERQAGDDRAIRGILDRMKTGLTLNESMRLNWCEIMAVGKRAPFTKKQMKKWKIAKWMSADYKPGDFVVMPESSESSRFWRGIWGKEYMLITETHEPVLLLPKESINDLKRNVA